jgi:hypothetical protein
MRDKKMTPRNILFKSRKIEEKNPTKMLKKKKKNDITQYKRLKKKYNNESY